MRLRRKFLIFAVLVHAIFIFLSILLLNYNRYLFVAAELLILVSFAISVYLYRAFLRPLNLIAAGVESIKDQDFSTKFINTGQDELGQLVEVYNQMIDQLRQERVRQQEQHYFLQRLIEAIPIAVIILDLDKRVDMLNPAARSLLGISEDESIGVALEELSAPIGPLLQRMKDGENRTVTVSGTQTYKCRKSHFLDRGFHRSFILVEELTGEIIATQKRAYEKIIRMMSHEINNSVGAVNSILDSSSGYIKQLPPEESEEFGNAIQVAIDRNRSLNRFMSRLADVVRIPPPVRERRDLHEILRSVQLLMNQECERRNIRWIWGLSDVPFTVDVDSQQMEQVMLNVVRNSIEAIGHDGTITVRTSNSQRRVLSIIDSGKGISPEERPHLFTPFYSTKRDGQGIGLTVIREILINHGFSFNLEPVASGGTEFWISF